MTGYPRWGGEFLSKFLVDELRRHIERRNLVVLLGAGVSIATTSAAPSWTKLLHDGVGRCAQLRRDLPSRWEQRTREQISSGYTSELIAAAESITHFLGGREDGRYKRWLRDVFEPLAPERPELIEALRELQDLGALIVTTNYDGLIEKVTGWPAVTWQQPGQIDRMVLEARPAVLHLHGYWDEPSSVILGIRSYEQILADQYTQARLHTLALAKIMLLVGFGAGLDDPNFDALRKWLPSVKRGTEFRHVRLCKEAEQRELTREHRDEPIDLLPYGADHADLGPFLRDLAAPTASARTAGPNRTRAKTGRAPAKRRSSCVSHQRC